MTYKNIHEISVEQLLTDMSAAAFDMGGAKVALLAKIESDGQDFQKLYDENEKLVAQIQKHLIFRTTQRNTPW